MLGEVAVRNPKVELEERTKPRWWNHLLAITIGALAFLISLAFGYGYGASIAAAAAAIVFPIVAYHRKFGSQMRFWVTVGLLAAVQVPLVMAVKPLAEQFKFVFLVAFGFVDFMLVAFVISRVCRSE